MDDAKERIVSGKGFSGLFCLKYRIEKGLEAVMSGTFVKIHIERSREGVME
jgi:hypothetical protein